eukprot:scaffold11629_cov131-Isochrysis_galbana.AAC.11
MTDQMDFAPEGALSEVPCCALCFTVPAAVLHLRLVAPHDRPKHLRQRPVMRDAVLRGVRVRGRDVGWPWACECECEHAGRWGALMYDDTAQKLFRRHTGGQQLGALVGHAAQNVVGFWVEAVLLPHLVVLIN